MSVPFERITTFRTTRTLQNSRSTRDIQILLTASPDLLPRGKLWEHQRAKLCTCEQQDSAWFRTKLKSRVRLEVFTTVFYTPLPMFRWDLLPPSSKGVRFEVLAVFPTAILCSLIDIYHTFVGPGLLAEPIFMKLGIYIMVPEPISTACFIYPSH
jgi:hypothetical protein